MGKETAALASTPRMFRARQNLIALSLDTLLTKLPLLQIPRGYVTGRKALKVFEWTHNKLLQAPVTQAYRGYRYALGKIP